MNRFDIRDLPLAGLKLVRRLPRGDDRGSLTRMFCADELQTIWSEPIAQINHTCTAKRGAVRGLHYQHPPHCEKKLVSCLRGEVWDVAVDLRAGSPTFLHWHAERLSPQTAIAMLIPEGFAHGFQTLCDGVEMLYFHSAAHHPEAEAGFSPLDSRLGIPWPEKITVLSDRDKSHPLLSETFAGVEL
jgi:dTDP-4-dehydrorhamnose 3,5-epimerase